MRTFAVSAIIAVAANAMYHEYTVNVDGNDTTKYYRSQDWSSTEQDMVSRVHVSSNNSILLKDNEYEGYEYTFKPFIRGGAIQYTVDLSSQGCGCVAGVYAVAMNSQCNPEAEQDMSAAEMESGMMPSCASIDVMQANPYGFNVSAHPCANGNCDYQSQCQYDMLK
jgi:hypothetical protein